MDETRHRQEYVNVLLAQALEREGMRARPEVILPSGTGSHSIPDVVVDFRGVLVAIESDFADKPNVEQTLKNQALSRVDAGLARVGIAVLYPPELRTSPDDLVGSALRYAVLHETARDSELASGTVRDLSATLRRVHDVLGQENLVEQSAAVLHAGIEAFVAALQMQPATALRFAATLGVSTHRKREALTREQNLAVRRIAGLILCNAMIFQEVLSRQDDRVTSLSSLTKDGIQLELHDQWNMIVEQINYYPLFHAAVTLLECVASAPGVADALGILTSAAARILSRPDALRHDLMGRLYHRLLTEAKHLGAYYTSVPAATLLLKLALSREAWGQVAWEMPRSVGDLRVADFACGTGTLLMAAAEAVTDNVVQACYERGKEPPLDRLHRLLLTDVIWGFDVLPSALHLTASTLALRNPSALAESTNLFCVELGGRRSRLGSLELLTGVVKSDSSLFSHVPSVVRHSGTKPQVEDVHVPPLDLCVMNPPFTRSVGGNLLFGSLPEDERPKLQKRLASLVKQTGALANTTAGLGSPFVAAAHPLVKDGGYLALVLPRAVLSGVAWGPTRRLIADQYHLKYVVTSHEPGHWNFSENTDLSETLLVAQRRNGATTPVCRAPSGTVFINLWHNPRNSLDALDVAAQVERARSAGMLAEDAGPYELEHADTPYGQAFAVDREIVANDSWFFWCGFAQAELIRAFAALRKGEVALPGANEPTAVEVCALSDLAGIGPDRRDIHDGFALAKTRTHYPAFWNHSARRVLCIGQDPNSFLTPRSRAIPGRNLRKSDDLWSKAGTILVPERLRLNTARTCCIRVPVPVLSNVWWPCNLTKEALPGEKALSLWLNCSLGVLTVLGHRTETCGAWCQLKKPIIAGMPILDVRKLSDEQVSQFDHLYEETAKDPLRPLHQMPEDKTRVRIDEGVARILGCPVWPRFGIACRGSLWCV